MIKVLKYYVLFGAAYILLVVFTMPFFISWGNRRNIIEKIYLKFIGSPFDYSESLWLIIINSVFWFVIFYILAFFLHKLVRKKK